MSAIAELIGQTLISVTGAAGDDVIAFETSSGRRYMMNHSQDCCESVSVDSIVGDVNDLIGAPILMAEEAVSCQEHPPGFVSPEYSSDSFTWTFYKLATRKGYVDIRWYGSSNGYYSESVDFSEIPPLVKSANTPASEAGR